MNAYNDYTGNTDHIKDINCCEESLPTSQSTTSIPEKSTISRQQQRQPYDLDTKHPLAFKK